jgi:hypothetical protein
MGNSVLTLPGDVTDLPIADGTVVSNYQGNDFRSPRGPAVPDLSSFDLRFYTGLKLWFKSVDAPLTTSKAIPVTVSWYDDRVLTKLVRQQVFSVWSPLTGFVARPAATITLPKLANFAVVTIPQVLQTGRFKWAIAATTRDIVEGYHQSVDKILYNSVFNPVNAGASVTDLVALPYLYAGPVTVTVANMSQPTRVELIDGLGGPVVPFTFPLATPNFGDYATQGVILPSVYQVQAYNLGNAAEIIRVILTEG